MAGTTLLSSPSAMLLGKKRSIRDTEEEEPSMEISFPHSSSNHRGTAVGFDDPNDPHEVMNHNKRYKSQSFENLSPAKSGFRFPCSIYEDNPAGSSNSTRRQSPLSTLHVNKMSRVAPEGHNYENDDVLKERNTMNKDIFHQQKYYDSLILSLKTEYELKLAQKQQEMEQWHGLHNQMQQENEQLKGIIKQSAQHIEENKILKKAVAIQDGRYKELNIQCEQQQQMLRSAMEHISEVERINRELTTQMNLMQYGGMGGDGFSHQPPDVF